MIKKERRITKKIKVGNIEIGGEAPISIQTMCTTRPKNVEATITQINELEQVGCDLIRLAIVDMADVQSLFEIKNSVSIPIVADVVDDTKLIMEVINAGVAKIRINPALLNDSELENIVLQLSRHNIPVRVSINSGSLDKEIKVGNIRSNESYIDMAFRQINRIEKLGFEDVIVSLKSTSLRETIAINEEFAQMSYYPLHIGMTQAGTKNSGVVLNSAAMGYLLINGIGSTMRMALGGDPRREVLSALYLLRGLGLRSGPVVIAGQSARSKLNVERLALEIEEYLIGCKKDLKIVILGSDVELEEVYSAEIGIVGKDDKALVFINGEKSKELSQDKVLPYVTEIIDQYNAN